MTGVDEMCEKERRARELMDAQGLDALAISTTANFAWLTCGGSNYVGIASETGVATAVITRDAKYIVCNNIEAGRMADEEVSGQGFEFATFMWYEPRNDQIIREIAAGGALGSDVPIEGAKDAAAALDPYRYSLTSEEIERYGRVGRIAGTCLAAAAGELEPGMTEHEIAAIMNCHVFAFGAVPIVTLVAADERIAKYRHPIPTEKKLQKCAMLVVGVKKWGLIVSATRLVHFGPLTDELKRKHDAVTQVDAAFIAGAKPGVNMRDVFKHALNVYKQTGFADEWQLHHQGGPTGYKPRDIKVHAGTDAAVVENQAFAWNPSITGTKSEDTIIAMADGPRVLSSSENWPMIEVEADGVTLQRSDILVR